MAKLDLKVLEELCLLVGVSGGEEKVADAIIRMVKDYADDIQRTPLGDVIVFKKGEKTAPKKLMICAHMDEVGMVVTDIDEKGYLRFTNVGGVDSNVLLGKTVYVNETVRGVIGGKPVHLMSGEEREKAVPIHELTIDIGASTKEEAEDVCSIGDYVNYEPFFEVCGDVVKAKSLDDRMGCAVLIALIRDTIPYDTYFVFSTREEVGNMGAMAASYVVAPELAIAVEGTVAGDVLGTSSPKACTKVGKGPAVSFVDGGTVYDRAFFKAAFECAKELGIECQARTNPAGRNDASVMHTSRGGARAAAVNVPCRYIHCPTSMANVKDANSAIALIKALSARMMEADT